MSEQKHTPGPWLASGTIVDAGDVHADGARVAKCWTSTFAPPREESAANANLIAAAPDLLAACKLWDQGFVEGEQFNEAKFLKWVNDNRRAARAAIAKAEMPRRMETLFGGSDATT